MNAKRRKALELIASQLEDLAEEERACFENLPDGLRDSEKGQAMEENADFIENAVSELGNIQ